MEQFPKMDFGGSRNGTVRLLWLLRARLLCIGGSGWPQWCENDSPTSEKTQSQLLYKLLLAVSRELWNWFHNDSIPEFSATNPTKNCHEVLFSAAARIYPWLSTVQGRCKCYDARSEFGSLEHMGCENSLSSLSWCFPFATHFGV